MKICPILLRGTLNSPLQYNIGRVEKTNQGIWEFCISTIACELIKRPPEPGKPPIVQKPFDDFCYVYSNFFEGVQVLDAGSTCLKPYLISQFHLKLNVGQKKLIAYKSRDFFEINNPTSNFEITITDSQGENFSDEVGKYVSVSVHLIFKRKS